ncbi:MAG: MFS transporter [Syntrophobacterales bacterium]|nr:MAG: MFS transporter [Syntrophobacterales bacterium]
MENKKMDKKALSLLSLGHMVTDINQGAVPVLLPFIKEALHISYTKAGFILLLANMTSSIIQPAFGHLSDRYSQGWFLPGGLLLACIAFSLTGFAWNYEVLLLLVVLSGIGVATFHPEGYRTAHFFTGQRKATGMAIFSVGGNLGFSLGPIMVTYLVSYYGLKGTGLFSIPGVITFFLFLFSLKWLTSPARSSPIAQHEGIKPQAPSRNGRGLLLLILAVTMRSWIQMGLMTFIPFYYINYLKGEAIYAGKLVFIFLVTGAIGALIGGPLADRWGHKNFFLITMGITFPLILAFLKFSGWPVIVILGLSGLVLVSTFSVTVVMAQEMFPHNLGIASGLMVGFAIGTGGIGVTLLGYLADLWGVPFALKTIALMPVIGFLIALFIPYPPKRT